MDGEYRKDFLIKDIITALQDAAKKVLKTQLKVNHVKLGDNVITFYFENNLSSRFNQIELIEELTDQKIVYETENWRPGDQKV